MRRPGSLPHAVMTEIQQVFIRGGHKVGDRLPSERDLAKQLSVGRSSLREAVQGLQTMGLVERRHGVGTFFGSRSLLFLATENNLSGAFDDPAGDFTRPIWRWSRHQPRGQEGLISVREDSESNIGNLPK
jgi:DNA-binding FadR family transcriptional regulator